MRLPILALATCSLILAGCGAVPGASGPQLVNQLQGSVHGGQQPVSGSTIRLFAAGTTGYGLAATSLLTQPVTTDAQGNFSITGNYTCPSSTSQLYIVATGGNSGLAAGTNNSALKMITALGPCSLFSGQLTLNPNSFITINEVTTAASIYALSAFLSADATQVGSSSTNLTGITNSFLLVKNLVNINTGTALTVTPAGNGTAPQTRINTLANILAPCINSDGTGNPCSALFAAATPTGGTAPSNTMQAMLSVARNPVSQVATLYGLSTATPPFQPTLSTAPNDWAVAIQYTGGALSCKVMALDASGNAWFVNSPFGGPYSVTQLSNNGTVLSGANGYTGGGLSLPTAISIDPAGNAWITATTNSNVVKIGPTGTILSGTNGFTGGGLTDPISIAQDGQGNAWIVDEQTSGSNNTVLIKLSNTGTVLSGASGFVTGGTRPSFGLSGVSIDVNGNPWVGNPNERLIAKFNNAGTRLSGSGYSLNPLYPITAAFDSTGNAWVNSVNVANFAKVDANGNQLTPAAGAPNCTAPGIVGSTIIDCFWNIPAAFAIDGAGNVWNQSVIETKQNGRVPNPTYTYGISIIAPNAAILSGATGINGGISMNPQALAIDGSGNLWADATAGFAVEFVGIATPAVQPYALGVLNGTLGFRP